MAKKLQKKKTKEINRPVQYRAGAVLEDVLNELTKRWQIASKHEAARRLACLAAFDFSQRHYELIDDLTERRYGRADFVEAAQQAHVHLEAVDVERCRHGKSPMSAEDRESELTSYAQQYVLLHRAPDEPEKEKERIKIFRTE